MDCRYQIMMLLMVPWRLASQKQAVEAEEASFESQSFLPFQITGGNSKLKFPAVIKTGRHPIKGNMIVLEYQTFDSEKAGRTAAVVIMALAAVAVVAVVAAAASGSSGGHHHSHSSGSSTLLIWPGSGSNAQSSPAIEGNPSSISREDSVCKLTNKKEN